MKDLIVKEVAIKDGVKAHLAGAVLKVKGPKGEVSRDFLHSKVKVSIEENKIIIKAENGTKREKTIVGAFFSHIKNMVNGVQEPFVYKLKICSGHFPMSVSLQGDELVIKNFLGEAVPRRVKLIKGAEVKVSGEEITISSSDKELAGQNAAKIESLCRITNRDRRIFQDGCYIIEKAVRNTENL